MKTVIIFFLILHSFICVCSAQESNLSNEIYEKQVEECGHKDFLRILQYNRDDTGWMDKIEDQAEDTIYLVEKYIYDVEFSRKACSATVWKKSDRKNIENKMLFKFQSYFKEKGVLKIYNEGLSGSYLSFLVDEWNIKQIKKEEQMKTLMYPSDMVATRIIKHKNRIQIDSFCFDEFINMSMDNKYDAIIVSE